MERDFLLPIQLTTENLDDAWHQAIRTCFQFGHEYVVEHGSYQGQKRYELDFVSVLIKKPWEQIVPILPEGVSIPPPASREQIETYLADYLYSDALSPKEDYRYGERLVAPKYRRVERPDLAERHVMVGEAHPMGVNQVREAVRIYREGGFGTNQCTLEIAMPNDILLQDPPCCRLIDTRVRYDKLHFVVYFRSWDLYAGFPVNLGGMELLKQMMAADIGVGNGSMIVASKGLHIYEQYYELVECQTRLSIAQLRAEGAEKAKRMGA
ncbi:MAG: thymidylate synthase [Planctomycetota bacterium]|jgi:thymidylate synthase